MLNKFKLLVCIALCAFMTTSCAKEEGDVLIFGLSADYPPFEFQKDGEILGFDVDIAKAIAQELGKKAEFKDIKFSSVLPSLDSGVIDAAISTITATESRAQNFDFSRPYYFETMAVVFRNDNPLNDVANLTSKKLACQLGTTMEIWVKKMYPNVDLTVVDNNSIAIQSLKAGHVDAVIVDGVQGSTYAAKNSDLSYQIIGKSDSGYAIAMKKGSKLKDSINIALEKLIANGDIDKLKIKWF